MIGLERGIYLASRSPRRRELLAQIGVRFHLLLFRARPGEDAEVDEAPLADELPEAYVERLARAKVEVGWRRMVQRNLPRAPVLCADTTVALKQQDWMESAVSRSEVRFKPLSAEEIAEYTATGECDDKAGAYAIQGRAARFIVELRGSYSGVMGLPLYETGQLLEKLGRDRRNSH